VNAFLGRQGWSVQEPVAEDGSARRYSRVEKSGRTAIFMETYGETPGHRIDDFIRIGSWLREAGLHAPEIYDADEAAGLLLLEDLGRVSFKSALTAGESAQELYALAADVLKHIAAQPCPAGLPGYFSSHVHAGHRRVIDWYVPALKEEKNPDGVAEAYLAAWAKVESELPPCPQGFIHADFHVENLMWIPGEKGLRRCGILDFQGAMKGPLAYDLGNLLEDARIDVPAEIHDSILSTHDENFQAWYRVLTTQFHCRVIGQFIKMAVLDGKTVYLSHIPRLAAYIAAALKDPVLAPVRSFFSDQDVDFHAPVAMNSERIRGYIREDAV
jgi:aminoglycoside/choline kinase family phosphotransferase